MEYLNFLVPSYPFFAFSGSAVYRPGDMHAHRKGIDYFDMLIIEDGTLYMSLQNTRYVLQKGDVLIIPPNLPHRGYKICNERTVFHWLHFLTKEKYTLDDNPLCLSGKPKDPTAIDKITVSFPLYQHIENAEFEDIRTLLPQLETQSVNYFNQTRTKLKITNRIHQQALFLQILQFLEIHPSESYNKDIAEVMIQYMNLHYADDLDLDTLCKITNCGPTNLIKCVKEHYNDTPMHILNRIRLEHARDLLVESDAPITAIAYAVGFSSSSYFSKKFSLAYGVLPLKYRKMHSKLPNE